MKDMVKKNRQSHLRGENNGRNILTEEDVKFIRNSKLIAKQLALQFGVSISNIYDIKHKRSWKHV